MKQFTAADIPGAVWAAIIVLLYALIDWLVEDKALAGIITGFLAAALKAGSVYLPELRSALESQPEIAPRSVQPITYRTKLQRVLFG